VCVLMFSSPEELLVLASLVEDTSPYSGTYIEFLCEIHNEIKNELEENEDG